MAYHPTFAIACQCERGTAESEDAVVLTALVFLVIQQLEGNVLTLSIQGQTSKVPAVIVFLAVTASSALAGLMGVLFAVPTLVVLRVLFDFFRVRLRTEPAPDPVRRRSAQGTSGRTSPSPH